MQSILSQIWQTLSLICSNGTGLVAESPKPVFSHNAFYWHSNDFRPKPSTPSRTPSEVVRHKVKSSKKSNKRPPTLTPPLELSSQDRYDLLTLNKMCDNSNYAGPREANHTPVTGNLIRQGAKEIFLTQRLTCLILFWLGANQAFTNGKNWKSNSGWYTSLLQRIPGGFYLVKGCPNLPLPSHARRRSSAPPPALLAAMHNYSIHGCLLGRTVITKKKVCSHYISEQVQIKRKDFQVRRHFYLLN